MTPTELAAVLRDKTCGEISCDECNAHRHAAAAMIDQLRIALADAIRRPISEDHTKCIEAFRDACRYRKRST